MGKIRLTLGLTLVFLVGGLLGVLGTEIYYKYRIERFSNATPSLNRRIELVTERLSKKLELDDQQEAEINRIVATFEKEIYMTRQKYMPEIKEIVDRYFALMKKELNPDQKEKLEKLHATIKHRRTKALLKRENRENHFR